MHQMYKIVFSLNRFQCEMQVIELFKGINHCVGQAGPRAKE